MLRGVIFDLDGTLVDSQLDFDAIRSEMALSDGEPILESIDAMPPGPQKDDCLKVLYRHERRGAELATLMPGAGEFLAQLERLELLRGLLTRNSRASTDTVLSRLSLQFSSVLTREQAPIKPSPAGLLAICEAWQVSVDDVLFFGDFHFDLQAGRNAGIRTVLYAPGKLPGYSEQADFVIRDFSEALPLVLSMSKTG